MLKAISKVGLQTGNDAGVYREGEDGGLRTIRYTGCPQSLHTQVTMFASTMSVMPSSVDVLD